MTRENRLKKRYSAWLSEATKEKLVELAHQYGTQATVIEIAIDRMYREEIGERVPGPEVATETTKR